jgi:hypothetical protein
MGAAKSWGSVPAEQHVGRHSALGITAQIADQRLMHGGAAWLVGGQQDERAHGIDGGRARARRDQLSRTDALGEA